MKNLENLCITLDYARSIIDDTEVIQILNYDDCQYHEEDEVIELEYPNIPIPENLKPLLDAAKSSPLLLVFKLFADAEPEIIMVYDPDMSVLYDANGKEATAAHTQWFMKLLFNAWQSC